MAMRIDEVLQVIQQLPEERNTEQIDFLIPWLRKRSNLLESLDKAVLSDIIQNSEYQRMSRDDVVIKQGERGNTFFIILRGVVSVYIDAYVAGDDDVSTPVPGTPNKDGEDTSLDEQDGVAKSRKGIDRSRFGRFIIKFDAGKSFGEIALLSDDSARNASIIVDEESDFLVIDRELFNRCLKTYKEKDYEDIRKFVDHHSFFRDWPQRMRKLLEMSLHKETYQFDATIIRQGEPVNALYFITRGHAKMTVEPQRHKQQYSTLWPFEALTDLYAQEFEWMRDRRMKAIKRRYGNPCVLESKSGLLRIRRSQGYAAAEKSIQGKTIELCSIQEGEIVGDIEAVLNLNTYMQTITCSTTTDVYILDKKNYDRLVGKKNPSTLDIIQKQAETKLKTRMGMPQAGHIPLMNFLYHKLSEKINPHVSTFSKSLPPLKTSKSLPDSITLRQHMISQFLEGKAELLDPLIPGSLYYKDLMQEKSRIRANVRNSYAALCGRYTELSQHIRKKPKSILALKESLKEMEGDNLITQIDGTAKVDDVVDGVDVPLINETKQNVNKQTNKNSDKLIVDGSEIRLATTKPKATDKVVKNNTKEQSRNVSGNTGSGLSKKNPPNQTSPRDLPGNKGTKLVLPPIVEEKSNLDETSLNPNGQQAPNDINKDLPTTLNNMKSLPPIMDTNLLDLKGLSDSLGSLQSLRSEDPRLLQQAIRRVIGENQTTRGSYLGSTQTLCSDFEDYSSDEITLSYLESRLKAFHIKYGGKDVDACGRGILDKLSTLPKLRRFQMDIPEENITRIPRPGGRVMIKRRTCDIGRSKYCLKDHAHVRHYMVSRVHAMHDARKTEMVLRFLMDNALHRDESPPTGAG